MGMQEATAMSHDVHFRGSTLGIIPEASKLTLPNGLIVQHITKESATKLHELGSKLVIDADFTRVFRYVRAGAADVAVALMVQAPAPAANHEELVIDTAVTANDTSIILRTGATAVTANEYAGGWVMSNKGTGLGQTARIKSHAALAAAVTDLTLTLYEPLRVAITASTGYEASMVRNSYDGVIITDSGGVTAHVVGATVVALTSTYYGWIQTWGPCAIKGSGAPVIGNQVNLSTATSGAVMPPLLTSGGTLTTYIGDVMSAGTTAETSMIMLKIDR